MPPIANMTRRGRNPGANAKPAAPPPPQGPPKKVRPPSAKGRMPLGKKIHNEALRKAVSKVMKRVQKGGTLHTPA